MCLVVVFGGAFSFLGNDIVENHTIWATTHQEILRKYCVYRLEH